MLWDSKREREKERWRYGERVKTDANSMFKYVVL